MDRNKPPALTSPWKIGFFVSLLLVTTSIGVGVLITRTFDLSWTWIQYTNGTWAFDKDSFLGEMLPLVVLVPLLSLFSYFLITGAVRKYKAFLDSGLDYKNLLQSLEKIDDLQNESQIKTLGKYPELKKFLLKAKNRISEREKVLEDKEKEITARMKKVVAGEEVKSELGALVSAISKGPEEGFREELLLTLPEVKQVEETIRAHLLQPLPAKPSMNNGDVSEIMTNLRIELRDSAQTLREKFEYIATEFEANENGARELEEQLGKLKEAVESQGTSDPTPAGEAEATTGLLANLDESSRALEALGEETKGVAINTALQAGSGEGGTTELIKLADDVRDLAAKFNGIAQNYIQVGQQVRSAVQNSGCSGNGAEVSETVSSISNRIALWVERAVVLSSKLSLFKEHYLNSIATLEMKLGGENEDDTYQAVQDLSVPDDEAVEEVEGIPADEFERQGNVGPFVDESEASNEDVVPGLEKEEDVFEEADSESEDELFANIPEQESADVAADVAAEEANAEAETTAEEPPVEPESSVSDEMFEEIDAAVSGDEKPLAPPPPDRRGKSGDFVQSHMNLSGADDKSPKETDAAPEPAAEKAEDKGMSLDLESHRYESSQAASRDKPAAAAPTPVPELKPEEEIFDLYELGAVDYQPDSVQHNA